jgi:hypothetical protein
MEDLLVEKEEWIFLDPSAQPTSTQSTGTHYAGTQPTTTQPTGMSKEDWEKLDRRERSIIRIFLEYSLLLNVSGESTSKEIWDKLGNLYQSNSLLNKLPQHIFGYVLYSLHVCVGVSDMTNASGNPS